MYYLYNLYNDLVFLLKAISINNKITVILLNTIYGSLIKSIDELTFIKYITTTSSRFF